MLTVDKSLERLQAKYGKGKGKGGIERVTYHEASPGASHQCLKASQTLIYENAIISSPNFGPRKTSSVPSDKFKLPSSFSPVFDRSQNVAHSTISVRAAGGSPADMSRSKINQSRSKFFQSLLPFSKQHSHSSATADQPPVMVDYLKSVSSSLAPDAKQPSSVSSSSKSPTRHQRGLSESDICAAPVSEDEPVHAHGAESVDVDRMTSRNVSFHSLPC